MSDERTDGAGAATVRLHGRDLRPALKPLQVGLTLASLAVLAAMLLVAVVHLSDRFFVDHVSGAWMALTHYAQEGVLYPDLFDGARYGGTRWMPLSISYNLVFTVAGDPLLGAKLASLVAALAMAGQLFWMLRTLEVPMPLSVGLVGVFAATEPFAISLWSPFRGDSLAVILQLAAVTLVIRKPAGRAAIAVAGVLAAAAFLSKSSAGWAPMAIGLFFLLRDRRALGVFVGAYAATVAVGLVGFSLWSDGRLGENLLALSASQLSLRSLITSPLKILALLKDHSVPTLALLPLALFELGVALLRDRLNVAHLAIGAVGVVSLVIFSDPGVLANHLLDLNALTIVGVGLLGTRCAREVEAARPVLLVVVAWTLLLGFDLTTLERLKGLRSGDYARGVTQRIVPEGATFVSEDPGVAVLRGEHPTVMDPYMWYQIHRRFPERTTPLLDQVRAGEIDRVVFLNDPRRWKDDPWYAEGHFGSEFMAATLERYEFEREDSGYWVFAPR